MHIAEILCFKILFMCYKYKNDRKNRRERGVFEGRQGRYE